MGKLNDEAKESLKELKPAFVATASTSGMPNVSAKGSLRVLDDDHVAFADVASPRTVANIKENNKVAVIVLGTESFKGCRIWGTGEVVNQGEIFEQFASALAERDMKANNVVVITVDKIEM